MWRSIWRVHPSGLRSRRTFKSAATTVSAIDNKSQVSGHGCQVLVLDHAEDLTSG